MKKTIITLLALAGVAVAAPQPITLTSATTVETANKALTWEGSDLTSWEVTFNVTPTLKANQTQIADAQIFSTARSGNTTTGLQFASNDDGTVEIYGHGISHNSTSTCLTVNTKTPITVRFVADYEGHTYTGGTFTVLSGETEYLNFTVDETILDTKLISGKASVWTQSGNSGSSTIFKVYDIAVTKLDDNYKAVPEPATATLSLLALAGLAMRRRRK